MKTAFKGIAFIFILVFALAAGIALFSSSQNEGYAEAGYTVKDIYYPEEIESLTGLIGTNIIISLHCDIDYRITKFSFPTVVGFILEGNGHSVFNLTQPLINSLTSTGEVRNLNIYGFDYTETDKNGTAGAVVRNNAGAIKNVSVSGRISGRTAGGIAGTNSGSILNCSSYVNISSDKGISSGGITANNAGTIRNCMYYGTITCVSGDVYEDVYEPVYGENDEIIDWVYKESRLVGRAVAAMGGIAANNYGTIEACASFGTLSQTGFVDSIVGGIAGKNGNWTTRLITPAEGDNPPVYGDVFTGGIIRDSFFIGTLSSDAGGIMGGGITGRIVAGVISGCYASVRGSGYVYGITGVYGTASSHNAEYPDKTGVTDITFCFSEGKSLQNAQSDMGHPLDGTNAEVTSGVLRNTGADKLVDRLNSAGSAVWLGESGNYPVIKDVFFAGSGTAADKFQIKSKEDWYKTGAFNSAANVFTFELKRDLDFSNVKYTPFAAFYGACYAGGYAFVSLDAAALFSSASGNMRDIGFINCKDGIQPALSGTGTHTHYINSTNFGYTSGYSAVTESAPLSGNGTQQNPYIITTKEELKYISRGSADTYFALGNSIAVNDTASGSKYQLMLSGFSGILDGRDYEIIGLVNEALIAESALTGTVKNLKIRGYYSSPNGSLAAATVGEYGIIQGVTVYGEVSGVSSGGIAAVNNGRIIDCTNYAALSPAQSGGIAYRNERIITGCENYARAEYGIAMNEEQGATIPSISNCANYYAGAPLYNGQGWLGTSLNITQNSVRLWDAGAVVFEGSAVDSAKLRTVSGFSLSVWKFKAFETEKYPYLYRKNKFFKKNTASLFAADAVYETKTFNNTTLVNKSDIEKQALKSGVSSSGISFKWYYSASSAPEPSGNTLASGTPVRDAGYYLMYASVAGSETSLGQSYFYRLTVNKGTLPSPDFITGYTVEGMYPQNVLYYTGDDYNVKQIKPVNYSSYGFSDGDYSYEVYSSGGSLLSQVGGASDTLSGMVNAGTYTVRMTLDNLNYKTVTSNVTITVTRAPLAVKIADKTINYGEAAGAFSYSLTLTVKSGTSAERKAELEAAAAAAVSQSEATPSSLYVQGSDADNYDIVMTLNLANYAVTVTKGVLKVNKLSLTADYLFSVTGVVLTDGQKKVYNGYNQLPSYTAPADITIAFDKNNCKNRSVYALNATFSKANYESLTLPYTFEITPAPLTVKPKAVTIKYGDNKPVFSLETPAFLGTDTVSSLTGSPVFASVYQKGDVCADYIITVSGYSSSNYDITFGTALLTVAPAPMTALFSYPDKEIKYNGGTQEYKLDTGVYNIQGIIYEYKLGGSAVDYLEFCGTYTVKAKVPKINSNYTDTEFTAAVTVVKGKVTSVTYKQSYTATFDGEAHTLPYEGSLPDAAAWTVAYLYVNSVGGATSKTYINAGGYSAMASFSGHSQYEDFNITTVLTVNPKSITLSVDGKAEYGKVARTPSVSVAETVADTLSFTFEYSYVGFETRFSEAIHAGKYTLHAVCGNKNYSVANKPVFEIEKLKVNYVPKLIEYTYGDYRDNYYFDFVRYAIDGNRITEWNFLISATGERVNVTYIYGDIHYGISNVISVNEANDFIFIIPEGAGLNKVSVAKRMLTVEWNKTEEVLQYNGAAQNPFTAVVGNYVIGDTITYSLVPSGNMRSVGEYYVSVVLPGGEVNVNYKVPDTKAKLTVTQAPITVTALDISVQKTMAPDFRCRVDGMQGGETLADLGINLSYICAYTSSSEVGAKFPVDIAAFTLQNYSVTFIRGYLTVVEKAYAPAKLVSRTYTYDGTVKSLTFEEALPYGSVHNFTNNYQTDVGTYNVTASVRFPDGTTQSLSAVLTINKATPFVTVEPLKIPFYVSDIAKLQNNDIIGSSTLNGKAVEGDFIWTGNTELKKGTNLYSVRFIPKDTKNVNSVDREVAVECVQVKEDIYSFNLNEVIISGDVIYKSGEETVLTLKDTFHSLELYVNGERVNSFILPDSGTVSVEVRFRDNKIYSHTYSIVTVKTEPPLPEIEWDDAKLFIDGGEIRNGNEIFFKEQCRVSLAEGYDTVAMLMVNGREWGSVILLGEEGSINLQIKYGGEIVYTKTFSVVKYKETPGGGEKETDNYLWAKVLGGIAGGALGVVLLFFIIKKVVQRRRDRKSFNPYDAGKK